MGKLIITAAISGAEVTKEHNPAVPYTIEETVREAKLAYEAGASIIHLHVREDDGTPTQDKDRFKKAIDAIQEACPDVIIQPSTGGAVGMSDEERMQPTELHPEMASLSTGTVNFGGNEVFMNTDTSIRNFARMFEERNVKPEIEIFDKGMIDATKQYIREGLIKEPVHFDFVMGVSIAPEARDLTYLVDSIPEGSTWTVAGMGRHEVTLGTIAVAMGGHVRVGFEDNVYFSRGVLAESNGQLVERIANISKEMGREIATPKEAREILSLEPFKGGK